MFPHTRRNLALERVGHVNLASISARAEEPEPRHVLRAHAAVYLRTRGGTIEEHDEDTVDPGLSPHTRRNLGFRIEQRHPDGSISAHAEEPSALRSGADSGAVYLRTRGGTFVKPSLPCRTWVYLRTRGGTPEPIHHAARSTGLSPHTRRNLDSGCSPPPRRGLSPHTRRNRDSGAFQAAIAGSISAHAEEPRPARAPRYR